jgi:hypothetical protein
MAMLPHLESLTTAGDPEAAPTLEMHPARACAIACWCRTRRACRFLCWHRRPVSMPHVAGTTSSHHTPRRSPAAWQSSLARVGFVSSFLRTYAGFFYQPIYLYRYPAVTVYYNGINGTQLFTAWIQNPNQNSLYKWYAEVYRGINYLYRSGTN